jgi:hypothetical protein
MKLLELASQTQTTHDLHLADLHKFIPNIPNNKLRRKLFKPAKILSKAPALRRVARLSNLQCPPTIRPSPSTRTIRCFKCSSPNHIQWYCVQYCCPTCRKVSPGHSKTNCLENRASDYDYHYRYYDIEGEPDGAGEC